MGASLRGCAGNITLALSEHLPATLDPHLYFDCQLPPIPHLLAAFPFILVGVYLE